MGLLFYQPDPVKLSFPIPSFGIKAFDNDLYWTVAGSIMRLRFSDDFSNAVAVGVPLDENIHTSSLAVAEGGLYAVHSDLLRFLAGVDLNRPLYIYKVETADFD
jgi:hypothetical protein